MVEPADVIAAATVSIERGGLDVAVEILRRDYPFRPVPRTGRRYLAGTELPFSQSNPLLRIREHACR